MAAAGSAHVWCRGTRQAEHHTHENKVNKGVRAPPTKQTSHHLQLTGAQECHSYPVRDFLSSRFLGKKHLRFLQKPKKSSRASEAQVCVLVRAHSTPICPSAGKTTQIAVGGGSCFPAPEREQQRQHTEARGSLRRIGLLPSCFPYCFHPC